MPLCRHNKLKDGFHNVYGYKTDCQFIAKSKIKTIQKTLQPGLELLLSNKLT